MLGIPCRVGSQGVVEVGRRDVDTGLEEPDQQRGGVWAA